MRAKYFKKLRKNLQWYDVEHTNSLFGSFSWREKDNVRVLAKNHFHACHRAKRRGYGLDYTISDTEQSFRWARWKVKLSGKSNNFKNLKYY